MLTAKIGLLVILLDLISKQVVQAKTTVIRNYDFAFSLPLSTQTTLIFTTAVMAVLFFYYFKNRKTFKTKQQLGFGFILGGGLSNLVERLHRGWVTDFIHIGNSWFNLADITILLGIFFILWQIIKFNSRFPN